MKYSRAFAAVISLAAAILQAGAFDVTFTGSQYKVIEINADKNTGLDKIYVVYDTGQVSEMKISGLNKFVEISKYSNLGGGYAQPVANEHTSASVTVSNPEGDMGYIIQDSSKSYYIWVVNYSNHKLELTSAGAYPEQDCENTRISVEGKGEAIHYYSIDGRQCELGREISLDYHTLEWSDDDENFSQVAMNKVIPHLSNPVTIIPPFYCSTTVDITGDRFLKEWGMERHIESSVIEPNGVAVHASAEQTNLPDESEDADPSNIIKTEVNGMGGSAPVDISFRSWTTDAVIHNEWQIASDESFENIDYRFNERDLDYTFSDEGTYYVRFVGSNADGTCEAYSDTFTVGVGSSDLRIPNAFTPNGDGVNDVWKVSYRSLISFSCSIFDRYGTLLYSFNDPSQGWDGKYKGKFVKPGVYFYVIQAKGADGRSYKKGGDINIIRSKRSGGSTTGGDVTPSDDPAEE